MYVNHRFHLKYDKSILFWICSIIFFFRKNFIVIAIKMHSHPYKLLPICIQLLQYSDEEVYKYSSSKLSLICEWKNLFMRETDQCAISTDCTFLSIFCYCTLQWCTIVLLLFFIIILYLSVLVNAWCYNKIMCKNDWFNTR